MGKESPWVSVCCLGYKCELTMDVSQQSSGRRRGLFPPLPGCGTLLRGDMGVTKSRTHPPGDTWQPGVRSTVGLGVGYSQKSTEAPSRLCVHMLSELPNHGQPAGKRSRMEARRHTAACSSSLGSIWARSYLQSRMPQILLCFHSKLGARLRILEACRP